MTVDDADRAAAEAMGHTADKRVAAKGLDPASLGPRVVTAVADAAVVVLAPTVRSDPMVHSARLVPSDPTAHSASPAPRDRTARLDLTVHGRPVADVGGHVGAVTDHGSPSRPATRWPERLRSLATPAMTDYVRNTCS